MKKTETAIAEKQKKPTIAELKEDLEDEKRMSQYYKKKYNDFVEIRKNIVAENISLVAAYELVEKECAQYEQEVKRLRKKWWNIFKN